jgi:LysR family transcriptional regulator for metE and metH
MHIEFRHLRTVKAIHENGGVSNAADILNITQSALSHQIKNLEEQTGIELFVRKSKPLRLTAAGMRLLRLADKILPEVDAIQAEFEGLRSGKSGRLHIAIECHACFEWLFPVLERFRQSWPDVDVDIRPGLAPRKPTRHHIFTFVRICTCFCSIGTQSTGGKSLYRGRGFP